MKSVTIVSKQTGEIVEVINNVEGIYDDGRTVEYKEHGDTAFVHLDADEIISNA